jgi:hypothetical protein
VVVVVDGVAVVVLVVDSPVGAEVAVEAVGVKFNLKMLYKTTTLLLE